MNLKNGSLIGLAIATFAIVVLVFRESFFASGFVGIVLQILSALLMLWARITFGRRSFHASAAPTEGGVMQTGPYRFLRHPIYAAIIYCTWVGVASHFSIVNCMLGIILTIGLVIRIIAEEHLVTEKYPEYTSYASRTKRVIPFIL